MLSMLSPGSASCYYKNHRLKYVKSASCVTQLSCVQPVTNVKNAASNLPVGARLQNFWQTWLDLGAGPKVVQILKKGCTLPFRIRPKVTRSPTVISCYVNPHRNSYLLEAYRQNCGRASTKPNFSWVFQPTIFGPKAQQQMETYIRSEQTESFPQGGEIQNGDIRTMETIRTSLQQGEWVTSIDFKDAYFHIPIQEQSRKYQISCRRSDIPVQSFAFRPVYSTLGVHCSGKGDETDGHTQGYKDLPIPRRLVGESQIPPGLSSAYSGSSENMPRTGLAGECGKVRAGAKADLRFCRLPV